MSEPSAKRAWLEAANGDVWPLDGSCSIGRSPSNTIVIDDRRVSRRHAVIHCQDVEEFWLVDLGSGNGSFVNGRRVSLPLRLNDGDEVKVSDLAMVFRQSQVPSLDAKSEKHASMTVIEVRNVRCWMLIADIVGSTELAGRHDPSHWATLVGSWSGECRRIVELYGGSINKYLGDGFLAVWRADNKPTAHVAGALRELFELQGKSGLPFRIVTHVGAISSGGRQSLGEETLSGLELVFLFRIEKIAGSLGMRFLCSEQAKAELDGHCLLESAGAHVVQGFIDDKPRQFFTLAKS